MTLADPVSLYMRTCPPAPILAVTALGMVHPADQFRLDTNGLATPVGERGEALSVGERQLVALARAYVADPDLLVLDEATSAVDPATEVRLQRTLEAVTRGRTTVAIAHRLSTVVEADEIIVLQDGRIAERGTHASLIAADGLYAEMWHRQAQAVAAAEAAARAQAEADLDRPRTPRVGETVP